MAHFAQLDDSNAVLAVNVIADADCLDGDGNESEPAGVVFCKSLWGADTIWKQTSFNGRIRKQYAVVGGVYDPVRNEYVDIKYFASWTLNATNDWTAPLAKPAGNYYWDEDAYNIDASTGWVELPTPS